VALPLTVASFESRSEARVNILVVDDRPAKLLAMEALLADLGENVVCVSSGADALRKLLELQFAVVLLDVNMPEMDGFQTAALIRQRPRCEHVPIIFMTADSDETHALQGYSLGAVDYILTPALPEVLRTKVKVFVDLFRMTETLARQADERVALAEERAARALAEEASRRTAFLAEAGKIMTRSLDLDSTLDAILRLLVPELGDHAVLRVNTAAEALLKVYQDGHSGPIASTPEAIDLVVTEAMDRARRSMCTEILPDMTTPARVIHGVACPLLARGRVVGTLGLISASPTQRYRKEDVALVEDVCGRAAIAIDNSLLYREIEQRDARKDQFVAMLAHELRNPLSAITSALGVLEVLDGRDETTVQAQGVIGRQAQHLTQLVDDLLDVARVATGKITLTRSPINLAGTAERCLKIFMGSGKAERHPITVETENVWVDADATRLDQILMNLISNAVKYTPAGGAIGIRVFGETQTAIFEVRDNGVGMSRDVLAHVFELFFQADRTPDRLNGGLGIGLTLARQLVELHGGSIEASSEGAGHGSRFTVRLPRVTAPASVLQAEHIVRKTSDRRLRILVIEDNEDGREMLRTLLTLRGHDVYEAADGPSGVDMACAVEADLALIDIGLPGCDGYEVARRIRASPKGKGLVLIAITGYGQPEDRDRALEAGFEAHIVKPIDPHHLTAVIAEISRRSSDRCPHL